MRDMDPIVLDGADSGGGGGGGKRPFRIADTKPLPTDAADLSVDSMIEMLTCLEEALTASSESQNATSDEVSSLVVVWKAIRRLAPRRDLRRVTLPHSLGRVAVSLHRPSFSCATLSSATPSRIAPFEEGGRRRTKPTSSSTASSQTRAMASTQSP